MILKVIATPKAMVPDYKRLFAGTKCFIGWRFDPTAGENVEIVDHSAAVVGARKLVRQGGYFRTEGPVDADAPDEEIGLEYARSIAQGELLPADQATADYAERRTGVRIPVSAPTPPPSAEEPPTTDTAATPAKKGTR